MPGLPPVDVRGLRLVKILAQADACLLTGFHRGRTESKREREHAVRRAEIDLTCDRDVSVLCAPVVSGESFVGLQLLPAVRYTDEPDRSGEPWRRGRQGQRRVVALGEEHRRHFVVADPRRIAAAAVGQVRGEDHVEAEIRERALERHEPHALQRDVAKRIGQHLFLDAIAAVNGRVANLVRRYAERDLRRLGPGIPLFLGEVRSTIGHDEPEVARARAIDARVVDLVENPVTQREPDMAVATDGRPEAALRARRPARRNPRPARRKHV